MKDAVATMGGLLPDDVGGRDAVHVAVISAISNDRLTPNARVALVGMVGIDAFVTKDGEHIGIVDPFLQEKVVKPGERFWLYLFPRTITGLSHRWSHPAFEDATDGVYATPNDKAISEKWLRDFCETADAPSYSHLMQMIEDGKDEYGDWDEFLHCGESECHGDIPDELWEHAEIVLAKRIEGTKPKYFTCGC